MSDRLITEHFRLSEFAQPARHRFARIEYPAEWLESRLRQLCEQIEILRAALGGRPVTILSGYRSPAYNRAIGGARRSQHVEGRAADIRIADISPHRVHDAARLLAENGEMTLGGLGLYPGFIHLDIRPGSRLARWSGSRTGS